MRYVFRDDDGAIAAIYAQPQDFATEEIAPDDPELLTFLSGQGEQDFLRSYLTATDSELLRIIEDLVNVLVDKNLVMLSDFPEAARKKLLNRKAVRERLQSALL
ncbi:MAG: hypothetical protein RID42_03855 [Alphaproteobacteria bacterium]